jgi:RNA polymerase sigma-70 factor (ECF subfamily)
LVDASDVPGEDAGAEEQGIAEREQYVGVRLPEPLLNEEGGWSPGPEVQAEFAQDVSVAFMLALERLSPLERAAFLLLDVFDLDFDEIVEVMVFNTLRTDP